MKHKLLIAAVLIGLAIISFVNPDKSELKEGDIVFQISKSRQSPMIQAATMSVWSHCGIVVEKKGELYVLEASNVVKLTPLDKWIKQGRGGRYKVKRVLDKPMHIKYKKYIGKPYDLSFKFDNGKYYCSELVYDIYKTQYDIELCKPKRLKSYFISPFKSTMKKRGMNLEQLVVAPDDLL